VEVDPTPRPLGLVIVALIAALLWSVADPSLGADTPQPGETAPAVATPV